MSREAGPELPSALFDAAVEATKAVYRYGKEDGDRGAEYQALVALSSKAIRSLSDVSGVPVLDVYSRVTAVAHPQVFDRQWYIDNGHDVPANLR